MKTSYVYKNKGRSENTSTQSSPESSSSVRSDSVNLYLRLKRESDALAKERENQKKSGVPVVEDEFVVDEPKQPKKKSKLGLILGISAAVVVIGGVGGFFAYRSHTTKVLNENYVAFCSELDSMYFSNPEDGMTGMSEKDIEQLRLTLDTYTQEGIDTSDISLKLLDMSYYLEDLEKLSVLKDDSRSVADASFEEELFVIENSVKGNYTLDSFKEIIEAEVLNLRNQQTVYGYVKEQLLAVTDVSSITQDYLLSEINSLKYSSDIAVFNAIKDKALALQTVQAEHNVLVEAYNTAVADLEAISAVQYDENGKEIKLSKKEKQEKEDAIAVQQAIVDEALAAVTAHIPVLREAELAFAQSQDALEDTTQRVDTLNARYVEEDTPVESTGGEDSSEE